MLAASVGVMLLGCAMTGASAELPPLAGDGVKDDTAAIQARLDSGVSRVELPVPKHEYVISRTLRIGSGQELILPRFAHIRLAPGSNCPMLENGNWENGDCDIRVSGGVWDMDNVHQRGNVIAGPTQFHPKGFCRDFFLGCLFRFDRVARLEVSGVTFRNPTTYSCQLTRTTDFTVQDIVFDFTSWNPVPLNMDGIHLDGGCRRGRIVNLHGRCFDDMVALNANDAFCSAYEGEICDIDIDGLQAEGTHRGVRLLSTGAPVRRVTIRNVHITTYRNVVGITHCFSDRPKRGVFEDIVVRDCFASSCAPPKGATGGRWPLVWVEGGCDVTSLVVDGFHRAETYSVLSSTVAVDRDARVGRLVLRNVSEVNRTDGCLETFEKKGCIDVLVRD